MKEIIAAHSRNDHVKDACTLCGEGCDSGMIYAEENPFCCYGCKTVHQILQARGELKEKEKHPLLQEAVKWGIIHNPRLKIQGEKQAEERKQWIFEIEPLFCPSCGELVELILSQEPGILQIKVDYTTDLASISYSPMAISKEEITQILKRWGFRTKELAEEGENHSYHILFYRWVIAAFCALNVMMFTYPLYTTFFDGERMARPFLAWLSLGLTLPVLTYCAYPLYQRAFLQFKFSKLGMETLVILGVVSATLLSIYEMVQGTYHVYFDTVTVLIAFLLLGKVIESKAKFSSKKTLLVLHQSLPKKGRKVFGDNHKIVPLKEVNQGDSLLAYTGEKIVLDGKILEGEGIFDESILTGEARGVHKKEGDLLLSGTVVHHGVVKYQVISTLQESTLSRIVHLIEDKIGEKGKIFPVVDKVVKGFIPLLLTIAFLTGFGALFSGLSVETALLRVISVLLIACPCAIGIAVPLVESYMMDHFTKRGGLLRNRNILHRLGNVTHFVFDKTGTVTEGVYQVLQAHYPKEYGSILKGLTAYSLHPVAKALHTYLEGTEEVKIDALIEIAGRGLRGSYKGVTYFLGSRKWAEEHGIMLTKGDLFFFSDHCLGTFRLGDQIRPAMRDLLKILPGKKILLSGDSAKNVEYVAKELAFDEFIAEVSPLEKQLFVSKLKEKGAIVAMIGDGINDAPALAAADVGISLLTATDLTIQVSDLLLTQEITSLKHFIQVAKRGKQLIGQNLFWAFFYNVLGVCLAIFGFLTPLFASFAMLISSFFVLFNAKRIKNFY